MAATLTPVPVRSVPDFTHRLDPVLLPELMDEPCTLQDLRGCLRDIAATTRVTLAYTPTIRFLENALAAVPKTATIHIVDVGCGGGDMLRHIARWARKQGRSVQLTGIDLNPPTIRVAQEFSAGDPFAGDIQWLSGDLFTHPATQAPDIVLSSLVTHHMRDAEIVQFLRWMDRHARVGWFISDLIRSPRAYQVFGVLSRLMRWHPFVQNDGLVSIRRAFREDDWQRLLQAAHIPASSVRLHRAAIGRLCLTRLR